MVDVAASASADSAPACRFRPRPARPARRPRPTARRSRRGSRSRVIEVRSSKRVERARRSSLRASSTRSAAERPRFRSAPGARPAVGRIGDAASASRVALGERVDLLARAAPAFAADSLPVARSCSASAAGGLLRRAADRRAGRRCRCARFRRRGRAPRRAATSRSLLIELAGDAAELAGRLVAELHQMLRIMVSSARLSAMRCDSTSSKASSERASARIATTERVKRSASLRRVRPNISQARPSRASGPAATATHCAICGEDSGWPASARPADQAVKPSHSAARIAKCSAEHLAPARAALLGLASRPLLLVEGRLDEVSAARRARAARAVRRRRAGVRRACGVGSWQRAVYHLCCRAKAIREGGGTRPPMGRVRIGARRAHRGLSGGRFGRACARSFRSPGGPCSNIRCAALPPPAPRRSW